MYKTAASIKYFHRQVVNSSQSNEKYIYGRATAAVAASGES